MMDSDGTSFGIHRPALVRVAYRMLGSIADAEDIVQEAFIRWAQTDQAAVHVPAAYLRRVVTRLCLDHLKSAHVRRTTYDGPWLPEPVIEDEAVEDVTLPLMLALERLSPLERAAFLLHDVFGESFEDIALALDRDAAACRQLASRARVNVRMANVQKAEVQGERPRYAIDQTHGMEIAAAFYQASRGDGIANLGAILAMDVRFHADGGGKRPAAGRILVGADEVLRAHAAIARLRQAPSTLVRYAFVNGLPGFVTREPDGILQTTALLIEDGLITAIYTVRNPDKLRHLGE
jgi:RNA polymerase sigma-70 factor (ECF subfamily)